MILFIWGEVGMRCFWNVALRLLTWLFLGSGEEKFSAVYLQVCVLSRVQLCDPRDCSKPGSSVHGISQSSILAGLPFPSPGDFPDPGIKPRCPALKADFLPSEPPESGLLFHTPEDLPNPGIKPKSLTSPALAGRFFTTVPPTTNCCHQVCAK